VSERQEEIKKQNGEGSKVNKKDFWEERYTSGNTPWDIGQVSPAFVKYLSSIEAEPKDEKKVAVLGCGRGHDAFYFAQNKNCKFDVYGFDFSDIAIRFCKELKEKKNIKNLSFYKVDFFKLLKSNQWKNYFDCVIEHTSLCAIDPKRRSEYIELMNHILKPGGKVIGLFFVRPKELGGPPYGITPLEIKELFQNNYFNETKELQLAECLHTNKLEGEEWFAIFQKK